MFSTEEVGPNILLRCRDHGQGIDETRMQELQEPFRRGDSARGSQGSGLGLAIVARIVLQHRGQLHLSNHPDGGLDVSITLPKPRLWMRR